MWPGSASATVPSVPGHQACGRLNGPLTDLSTCQVTCTQPDSGQWLECSLWLESPGPCNGAALGRACSRGGAHLLPVTQRKTMVGSWDPRLRSPGDLHPHPGSACLPRPAQSFPAWFLLIGKCVWATVDVAPTQGLGAWGPVLLWDSQQG